MRWLQVLVSLVIVSISASQNIFNSKVGLNRHAKQSLGYAEDSYLNFTELATKYGYVTEEHFVTTEDGYILRLFRIPQGLNRTGQSLGTPVLAVHGLAESADSWILGGPGYSLGYQLADAGYDLWLTNYRGNTYSRNHTTLDPDNDVQFWKFSADEMAEFDLPALIEYILNVRGLPTLNYIGFSQGTNVFYKMGAYKPDYYNKVKIMIALAPVAYVKHIYNPFSRIMSNMLPELQKLGNDIGLQEVLDKSSIFFESLTYFCQFIKVTFSVCSSFIFSIAGDDYEQLREELMPVLIGHIPCGVSLQSLISLAQGLKNNDVLRFDHGREGNLVAYGSPSPPKYNMSLVSTPVALFIGQNDWLSSERDVARLRKELPNVIDYYVVPKKKWNHFDFLMGKDAPVLIGNKILRLFSNNN